MTNKNLISIKDLSDRDLDLIFSNSKKHFANNQNRVFTDSLKGKTLINFFFENSTRTRTSFEIAAKNLGAGVINIDISLSSLKKGETIIDTAKTINAMNPDFVAIRHNASGIVNLLKQHINAAVIKHCLTPSRLCKIKGRSKVWKLPFVAIFCIPELLDQT